MSLGAPYGPDLIKNTVKAIYYIIYKWIINLLQF